MGTLIRSIVVLAVLGFVFSLLLGKGSGFAKAIRRITFPVIIIVLLAAIIRGVWIPNAGGGMAINQNEKVEMGNDDYPVNIIVGENGLFRIGQYSLCSSTKLLFRLFKK